MRAFPVGAVSSCSSCADQKDFFLPSPSFPEPHGIIFFCDCICHLDIFSPTSLLIDVKFVVIFMLFWCLEPRFESQMHDRLRVCGSVWRDVEG